MLLQVLDETELEKLEKELDVDMVGDLEADTLDYLGLEMELQKMDLEVLSKACVQCFANGDLEVVPIKLPRVCVCVVFDTPVPAPHLLRA